MMIKVIARKGVRVPVEGNPDRYITDEKAVDVPETTYWHRRLKDGDLLLYVDPANAPPAAAPEAVLADEAKPAEKNTVKSAAPAAKADK